MSFDDVLVALTTYPELTATSAVDDAISLAVALEAQISAIACMVEIQVPGSPMGTAVLNVGAMVAAENSKSKVNSDGLLNAFQSAAEKHGVFQERILAKCLASQVSDEYFFRFFQDGKRVGYCPRRWSPEVPRHYHCIKRYCAAPHPCLRQNDGRTSCVNAGVI